MPISVRKNDCERLKRQVVGQHDEIPPVRALHQGEQNQLVGREAVDVAASERRESGFTVAELDQCRVKLPSLQLIANCLAVRRARYDGNFLARDGFEIDNSWTGPHQNSGAVGEYYAGKSTILMRDRETVLEPHSMSAWPSATALKRVLESTGTHVIARDGSASSCSMDLAMRSQSSMV